METTRTSDPLERRAAVVASFAGAWEAEAARVSEVMASGWRVPLERAVDEALQSAEREHVKAIDALRAEQKRFSEKLGQNLRRLRVFESETQWSNVVADAVGLTAARALLFSINADKLRFQAARGFDVVGLAEIPLAEAGAFQAAVSSAEATVALKTARELSGALAAVIGEDPSMRVAVYPITTRARVAAVVYAEGADAVLLDMVVTAAGAALEGHMGRGPVPTLVEISPAAGTPFITRDEEERHSRAQRFARVQVAEIRLYHSVAVKSGRADSNLYRALKTQIDEVRRVYQEQYLKNAPNMTDYLHQEILRTLANGNSELLGPDYPGALV